VALDVYWCLLFQLSAGVIRLSWLGVDLNDKIVGLSAGGGIPQGFEKTICRRLTIVAILSPLETSMAMIWWMLPTFWPSWMLGVHVCPAQKTLMVMDSSMLLIFLRL